VPPHTLLDGDPVELSLRPEYIVISAEGEAARANTVDGVINDLLFTGERFEARIRIGGDEILLNLPPDRAWHEGEAVRLTLPADAVSLWPCDESVS
jgi:iron(III) transport system ATP-binding protein